MRSGLGLAQPLQDFDLAVALGTVRNSNNSFYEQDAMIGRNDLVGMPPPEALRTGGGAFYFPRSAEFVRIQAGGNANDSASGTGARSIAVIGVKEDFTRHVEILATNGASASAFTTEKFWRINSIFVHEVGTYGGANTGSIMVEDASSNEYMRVEAGESLSKSAQFGTQGSVTTALQGVVLTVEESKSVTFNLLQTSGYDLQTPPYKPTIQFITLKNVAPGIHVVNFKKPLLLPEKTDFCVTANTVSATSSATFTGVFTVIPNK